MRAVSTACSPAIARRQGEGNVKNGNKYLAWAFVEAANFAKRFCPEAKRFYERKKAKTSNIVATKALAHKLARACYHILKEGKPFEVTRCFAWRTTTIRRARYGDWGCNQLN
jgi:transposase